MATLKTQILTFIGIKQENFTKCKCLSFLNIKIMLHVFGEQAQAGDGAWKPAPKGQARPRQHSWVLGCHYLYQTVSGPCWSQVSFHLGSLPGISGVPVFLTPPFLRHCHPITYYVHMATIWFDLDRLRIPSRLSCPWARGFFSSLRRHLLLQLLPHEIPNERELNWSTLRRKRWKEALKWSGWAVQDQPARSWDEGLYFLMFICVKKSRILCF